MPSSHAGSLFEAKTLWAVGWRPGTCVSAVEQSFKVRFSQLDKILLKQQNVEERALNDIINHITIAQKELLRWDRQWCLRFVNILWQTKCSAQQPLWHHLRSHPLQASEQLVLHRDLTATNFHPRRFIMCNKENFQLHFAQLRLDTRGAGSNQLSSGFLCYVLNGEALLRKLTLPAADNRNKFSARSWPYKKCFDVLQTSLQKPILVDSRFPFFK